MEAGLNYLCAGYRRFYAHARAELERTGALVRVGRRLGAIMGELEAAEHDEHRRWQMSDRNVPSPCASGTKYKRCCLARRRQ